MFKKLTTVAAWACLIFIIYATLSHAGWRPRLTTTEPAVVVVVERFGAYGLLGLLFCLAYPRRIALVCVLAFGSAVGLELLQIAIPDRDAGVIDAVEKLAGGVAGIASFRALHSIAGRLGYSV
jgi:VanZ family protein